MADSNTCKSPTPVAPAAQFRSTAAMPGHVVEHHPAPDLANYLREYAREKPEVAALWCFGIGFRLGWKLKIW